MPRLLETGLMPWFWLDYSRGWPAIFGDRKEGYLAPMVFTGDTFRLEVDGTALVTMTRTHDGTPMKIEPGIPVPLSDLRFRREDLEEIAAATLARHGLNAAADDAQAAPERSSDEAQDVPESVASMPDEPGIPVACLATRRQIQEAFGRWGFKANWFDNMNDRQWLKDARKRIGQGQRGQVVEPLFCPYEVMQGLINKVRGRRMEADTGWRVLEHKFPAAYALFSVGDPRERTG